MHAFSAPLTKIHGKRYSVQWTHLRYKFIRAFSLRCSAVSQQGVPSMKQRGCFQCHHFKSRVKWQNKEGGGGQYAQSKSPFTFQARLEMVSNHSEKLFLSWKICFQVASFLENFMYVDYQTICKMNFWKVTFLSKNSFYKLRFGKIGGLTWCAD